MSDRSPALRTSVVPYQTAMRVLDALNYMRGAFCDRSGLPLALRIQDVRHLRHSDEWPGSTRHAGKASSLT